MHGATPSKRQQFFVESFMTHEEEERLYQYMNHVRTRNQDDQTGKS
jgi:hypothetical protein